MKRLTIKRSLWLKAKKGDLTTSGLLYDPDTKRMCCLGFYCHKICKIGKKALSGKGNPSDIDIYKLERIDSGGGLSLEERLIQINDRNVPSLLNISNTRQESLIAKYFKLIDIEVTFVP